MGPCLMQIVPLYLDFGSNGSLYLDLPGRTSLVRGVTNSKITYNIHLLRCDLSVMVLLAWLLLNFATDYYG